ncbi:hypothetical protein LJC63_13065, partial [Ruminococcaceae bacterium OttesenSCG-928-L11]|nr:hypothetical protein [Ruminococcaceae bacterium OttesenSCG-928-L11]
SLIDEGLQHRLLVMLAGPGYGKTQAMADYIADCDARVLWLRLGALDNLPSHFWDHLLRALRRECPQLTESLHMLEFPDDVSSFAVFAQLLKDNLCGHSRVIWVFDDYGEIHNRQVSGFVRMLTAADLDGFSLVLISNILGSTDSVAFISNRCSLLLTDDLRFTRNEIRQLYGLYDIVLDPGELDAVERYTEGWPLALHLLVSQSDRLPDLFLQGEHVNHHVISLLFEERFFSAYDDKLQKLLVKLSMLDAFTQNFTVGVYDGEPAELKLLETHPFLIWEPSLDRYFLHYLYRVFLQTKQYLLTAEEQKQLWRQAAEYYAGAGRYIDAISCYRKCGEHIAMLGAIRDFLRLQHGTQAYGIKPENGAFFLEHLDLLTPDEVREHPMADYFRALIYLNTMELDKAERLFQALEQRLLADNTSPSLELLGDVYAMIGALHMMRCREDFGDYYKKAAAYLPNGTNLQNKRGLLIQNNHNFSMSDNRPGALERMERAVHFGIPWASKALCGGMSGIEHLFSAEAAYLTHRLADARQHAYRAIYMAEPHAQHDVVCNAYLILARVGFLEGNLGEMTRQLQSMGAYAGRYSIGVLKEIHDTALAWYHIKLHDCNRVPRSFLQQAQSDKPVLSQGRIIIVYANYLICTGEYARLVGMLEYPVGLYLTGGIFHDRISLFLILAIGYYHLGNTDAALQALWNAYDMTHANGLTALFIEGESHMCALVELARRQDA